jgi:hypothetical protein
MSADHVASESRSLDLGASPVRASESTNLMVAEHSRDHAHFPVRVPHVPIANLLRDCLRELDSPTRTDDPSDSDMARRSLPDSSWSLLPRPSKPTTIRNFSRLWPRIPSPPSVLPPNNTSWPFNATPAAPPGRLLAPPAAPLAASRNPLADHWKYDGSRCAALGTEPVSVHFWLEQIIHEFHGQGVANGVTQGQDMRRLLHLANARDRPGDTRSGRDSRPPLRGCPRQLLQPRRQPALPPRRHQPSGSPQRQRAAVPGHGPR